MSHTEYESLIRTLLVVFYLDKQLPSFLGSGLLAVVSAFHIHYSRYMDKFRTLDALAALGQETRLDVFRLLIKAGASGSLAGEIAVALNVRQNTMSTNLSILLQAGLIRKQREGRTIRYFADMNGIRGFLAFLMEDCCGGRPELCQPVIKHFSC